MGECLIERSGERDIGRKTVLSNVRCSGEPEQKAGYKARCYIVIEYLEGLDGVNLV